jgi:hypothetical protein
MVRKPSIAVILCSLSAVTGLVAAPLLGPGSVAAAAPGPAQPGLRLQLQPAGSRAAVPGELSVAQRRALGRGYLVPDEPGYATAKAAAVGRATPAAPSSPAPAPSSPALDGAPLRSWQGIDDPGHSPTDSTGAIGPSRYIELVNSKVAFYDRTNDTPLSVGTLAALTGDVGNLFDPYMIWDPTTERFYYVADNIVSRNDNRLEVGFSKTSTPSSTADFCKFVVATGAELHDFPKLGDTSDLWMIGTNVFDIAGNFLRSDVTAITKPAAGSTCPAAASFTLSQKQDLRHANTAQAFTPIPVNQTDTDSKGWIVSAGFGSSNFLSVFSAKKNASNQIVVGAAKTVSVASFSIPANAPQLGSNNKLDTLDGRLTNAVSAIDPSRGAGTGVAIWTQHAVFGGPGAQVRWYEIDPLAAPPVQLQAGAAGSSAVFAFNGAIAPDRRVNGASAQFGSSMVLGYNTSSSTQFLDVVAVSKRGSLGQTAEEVIKAGTVPQNDFSCPGGTCRSGDYAGATPDPASDTNASDGVVWLTNQTPGNDWHTWNFAGRPSAPPVVSIAPPTGPKGTAVTVSGQHFAAGETVNVKYKTGLTAPKSVFLCSATANSSGSFSCNGAIPTTNQGALGAHTIVAKGVASQSKAKTTFTLTS